MFFRDEGDQKVKKVSFRGSLLQRSPLDDREIFSKRKISPRGRNDNWTFWSPLCNPINDSKQMSSKRILLTNLFSLSGIQVINYIIPVLVVPYIVRIIGPENYGLINFAQAFTAYFILIVNYSFDLSATREISINRDNKEKLSHIFSSVLLAKIFLFFITLVIFFLIVLFVPKFKQDIEIFIFAYIIIIGNIFLPIWLFQGLEKLARLSVFNFIIKTSYAVSIFLFVSERNDYLLIPLILSISQIVVGIAAFFYSIRAFQISLFIPGIKEIQKVVGKGWNLFLSSVSINLYTTSNVVILGLFSTNLSVGYFSASSKIISVAQALMLGPMNQAFFPRISSVINYSRNEGIALLKKLTFAAGIILFITSFIIFIFSDLIIRIVFGSKFMDAAVSLRIMAFLPLIIGLSNVFGVQGMINLKMDKQFLILTFIGALISLVLNFILVPVYFENGTAVSWLITEVFITVSFFVVLLRNRINLLDWKYFRTYLSGIKLNK